MIERTDDQMRKSAKREKDRLQRLEYWLDNSRRLSSRSDMFGFMNHSQGVCILAGIDPERSTWGQEGYGWYLLPGALQSFMCPSYPCNNCEVCGCDVYPVGFDADYSSLYDAIEHRLSKYSSLGFKQNMRIREAIEYAIKCEIEVPWLRSDFIKPKFLPKLPKGAFDRRPKFRGEISDGRKTAGHASVGVNDPAIVLSTEVPPLFDELKKQGFPAARFASSNKVNWWGVTKIIFDQLDQGDPGLPEIDSVYLAVRKLAK